MRPRGAEPRAERRHAILCLQYLEGLSPDAICRRLAIGRSTYYREHQAALDDLGDRLLPLRRAAELAALPARGGATLAPIALIGRETEIAALNALLTSPNTRIVTLVGPGGVGKTRLAQRVAADLAPRFPDGVHFVPLEGIADAALVVPAIARVLGVGGPGAAPDEEDLRRALGQRRVLLVLDNVEQVLGAGPAVAALVAQSRQARVLVTSRAPLGVYGEQEFPLRALSLPHPAEPPDATTARASEAVQLFVARARAIDPAFAIDGSNAIGLIEICRRLDGLPLAIELAAARVRTMTPEAMRWRLDPMLPLLAGGPRDAPARHRTMRATIAWSDALLEPAQRRLFRQIATFAGGATLEAIESVCAAPGGTLEIVDALAAQSLLQRSATEPGRLVMLGTVREWALEQLDRDEPEGATRERHAAYFLRRAEVAAVDLRRGQSAIALRDLAPEVDNLRAALRWFLTRQDAARAGRLTVALARFWYLTARLTEGRAWFGEVLHLGGAGEDAARAAVAVAAGELAAFDADLRAAIGHFGEGLALARQQGDRVMAAAALLGLGMTQTRHGEEGAAAPLAEALALYQEMGDRRGIEWTLLALGSLALRAGDIAGARARFLAMRESAEAAGDGERVAVAREWLGNAALDAGDLDEAAAQFGSALIAQSGVDDPWLGVHTRQGLALVALARGAREEARRLLVECLRGQRDLNDTGWLGATFEAVAAYLASGEDRAVGGSGRAARDPEPIVAVVALELIAAARQIARRSSQVRAVRFGQEERARRLDALRERVGAVEAGMAAARGAALDPRAAIDRALEALG